MLGGLICKGKKIMTSHTLCLPKVIKYSAKILGCSWAHLLMAWIELCNLDCEAALIVLWPLH